MSNENIFERNSFFSEENLIPDSPEDKEENYTIDSSEEAKEFLDKELNLKDFKEKDSLDIIDIILSPTRAIYFYLNSYYYGFNLIKEIQMSLAVGTISLLLGLALKVEPFKLAIIISSILVYVLAIVKISSSGDKRPFREILKEDLNFVKSYESWVNTDTSIPRDMMPPPLRNQLYKEGEELLNYSDNIESKLENKSTSKISNFFNRFKTNPDGIDEVEMMEKEFNEHNEGD